MEKTIEPPIQEKAAKKPSKSETGHAKNVANFEELIGFCKGYGAKYNPSNPALTLATLNALLAQANNSLKTLNTAKTGFDNASNAREVTFKPLKKLSTRVVNALAATEAVKLTVDDAKTVNKKIQGKRAVKVDPDSDEKTISVSQQSFNSLLDNFGKLLETVTGEKSYTPNEADLKITTLNTFQNELAAKNSEVITATTALSNARISRNETLYADEIGLCDIASNVKNYVKSVYGARSPQYKQVSKLQFKDITKR